MFSSGTIYSLLLLSVLWVDFAMAGSSFLSPEHQKVQRKESKKPPVKLQSRATEGWLHPEYGSLEEGAEDELEIRKKDLPVWEEEHLETEKEETERRKEFNAPFDIGIKLSGAQYKQHGGALGKFLQDILWEDDKEVPSDK